MLQLKSAVMVAKDEKGHVNVKKEPLEEDAPASEPRQNFWPVEVVIKEESPTSQIPSHIQSEVNHTQGEEGEEPVSEKELGNNHSIDASYSPLDIEVKLEELDRPIKQEPEESKQESILGVPLWSDKEQRSEAGNGKGLKTNIMPEKATPITESRKIIHCTVCRKVHVLGMCPKALEPPGKKKSKKSGRKPHKCDVCGRAFQDARALKIHKFIHTGEKPYKCDICDKPFSQQGSLQRHKSTHSGDKPYACDICGKTFSRQDYIQPHKLIHVTDKPFKCDTCGKSFAYKCALKNHTMSHLGEKPHKCDICGQCFSHRGSLPAHKLIHVGKKEYACETCGKTFLQQAHLRRHKFIHEEDKPHRCEICSKSFVVKGALMRHITVHFRESKYKCDVCSMTFPKKVALIVHKVVHIN